MLKIKSIIFFLFVGIFLTACGEDRANTNDTNGTGVLGVVESDRDGDGLSDNDEETIYGTNPDSNDTDGDGLLDEEEINVYETNATNPDTDGDCLLDGFEILNYETNATNSDTDFDGVADGIEIYTYGVDLNKSCIKNPETLVRGVNLAPAIDNIPNDGSDIINALDPRNHRDSDGDGLSDAEEIFYGTNFDSNDTDGDGLLDEEEITIYDTNVTNPDTDGDGLLDGEEINVYETNATNPDTDGDNLLDGQEINVYELDPDNNDTDGDNLLDGDEVNLYGTNPDNNDTDEDGLLDAEEINIYDTNATNPDTDGDGLSDGLEINTYETNAKNPDTDGDCLLDGFEILNYETNATNIDTDGDTINDGIEIYSYVANDLNVSCLSIPETLSAGYNRSPARDGIPNLTSDVINALDPTNDSDGDGQSNIFENNCTEGNASNSIKFCPSIVDTEEGRVLTSHGYSYVPGGFDVDGDGVNEGGFWISRYQARKSGIQITSEVVIDTVGNVNQYISKNFKVLNRNVDVLSYDEAPLSATGALAGNQLIFDEESISGIKRISNFTPYLAEVCLSQYVLKDDNGTVIDVNITMPSLKQYVHVKMLLDADLVTPNKDGLVGDGRHIRNGVLGIDPNVPLFSYNLIIDEFGEELKEYVRNLVQLRDTFGRDTFTYVTDVPIWWDTNISKFKEFDAGANATQDLGNGIGPEKDSYAVIVRGGEILDLTQGVSGALTDDDGRTNGISFRAATDYLY